MTIEEYQLARHENHTLGRVSLEEFITVKQQLHQLAGIA